MTCNQNEPVYDLVYHCDYRDARMYMICLRLITWTYGFILMFLLWMQIFPNIGKASVGIFSIQILYVLIVFTLCYRQHLRHAIIVIFFSLIISIFNGYMSVSFIYRLIECRWYELCNDNNNSFLWTTLFILTLFFLNICILFISSKTSLIIYKFQYNNNCTKNIGYENYVPKQVINKLNKQNLYDTEYGSLQLVEN
jgi:hypothetical protein